MHVNFHVFTIVTTAIINNIIGNFFVRNSIFAFYAGCGTFAEIKTVEIPYFELPIQHRIGNFGS